MKQLIDLAGRRFGRLTVLRFSGWYVGHGSYRGKRAMWLCHCECGQDAVIMASRLKRGKTRSCGCLSRESAARVGRSNLRSGRYSRVSPWRADGRGADTDEASAITFLQMLWTINHGLATSSNQMRSRFGVTVRQRLVIFAVSNQPGISPGDLAKILCVDPSTLTGFLRQMDQRGLIRIETDTRDRRRLQIHVTSDGRQMGEASVGMVEAAVSRTLSLVSSRKVQATREVLGLLAEQLERH